MFTFQKMCLPAPYPSRGRRTFAALFEWLGKRECKFIKDHCTRSLDAPVICGYLAGEALPSYRKKVPPLEYLEDYLQPFVATGEKELIYRYHDRCDCACSPSGCKMIGVYFRYWLYKMRTCGWKIIGQGIDLFIRFFKKSEIDSFAVREAILRIILFHMLDIEHTCCQLGWPHEDPKATEIRCDTGLPYPGNYYLKQKYPPSFVAEIREDEAEMITRLDTYVAEAMQRYINFQGDFSVFVMDFLLERFWYKDRRVAKAQQKAARRLGIQLERRGHKNKSKPYGPLDEIHPCMDKWLRENARNRGYCRNRLR